MMSGENAPAQRCRGVPLSQEVCLNYQSSISHSGEFAFRRNNRTGSYPRPNRFGGNNSWLKARNIS